MTYSALDVNFDEEPPDEEEFQDADDLVDDLMKMEERGLLNIDSDSVYGLAIVMPQIARSMPNRFFMALAARSFFLLILNCIIQGMLLCFIGQAVQINDILSGRMHLCDFGAALRNCPDGDGCVGPGGTRYTKTRLYGFQQWTIQQFVKTALLDVLPEQRQLIEEKVDPGEFGMENYWCRFVCCFLFAVSMLNELFSCFEVAEILWAIPAKDESWIELKSRSETPNDDVIRGFSVGLLREAGHQETFASLKYVSFKVQGMPRYWKLINLCVVLIPKFFLWWLVCWQGFILLMETASNVDLVLSSLAMAFITNIDELILVSLSSIAARHIMTRLESIEIPTNKSKVGFVHFVLLMIPRRFLAALLITVCFCGKYYLRKCKWDGEYGLYVSQDMKYPATVDYQPWDLLGKAFIPQGETFWRMPHTPA